ncbi:MAG: hypothetical protein JF615_04970 [Asticcacaulis sp.]|nr:hypothetical protein [Asticcacaulis sp.]
MRVWARVASVVGLSLALSGCLTIPPETQAAWSSDIDLALRSSPEQLHADADRGDRHAMMAYSVVLRYGLHGAAVDLAQAARYANRAAQPVRYQTSFIWIGATKKMPGHMMPVTTPIYDYSPAQARVVENCAAILAPEGDPADLDARMEKGVCGGLDNYRRLKRLWHETR